MHPIPKTVGLLSASTPSDCEIVLTRQFKAPRQLVWDAHTKPELVRLWLLGPPGWTMPVCEIDLREGGSYRYEWHSRNGMEMALSGVYREVSAPERIRDTSRFDDDWTKGPAENRIEFAENGDMTDMTMTITYASREVRDFALSSNMMQGMEAGFERLEQLRA